MSGKSTQELFNELIFANSIDAVLEHEFLDDTLSGYLQNLLKEKALKKSDVIKKSGLNATFAYQIFSGERKASRNKLLQLAFAMGLTAQQTQHLLTIAGHSQLYSKNRRDAVILFCLIHTKTLEETDDILFDHQEALLCES